MDSTNPKPVFLYLKDCPLSDRQLKKISEAGYITVPVASFNAVKIVEPALLLRSDPISRAAFRTIAAAGFDSVAASFGRQAAKALGEES